MAIETELKLRVDSHEPVRARLRALAATPLGRVLETNHILDNAHKMLFGRGCGLRVRVALPLDEPGSTATAAVDVGGATSLAVESHWRMKPPVAPAAGTPATLLPGTLTFKGPKKPGVIRSREEIEVDFADAGSLLHLLHELGFDAMLVYQKRRESWMLDSCKIELDEPACLGLFVEIEGPDEHAILAAQSALGLERAEPMNASYVGLLMSHCQRNNIPPLGLCLDGAAS